MTFLNFIINSIGEHLIISYSIIAILLTAFITIRYNEIKTKREKFEKEYSEFKQPVIYFIEGCLKREAVSLNMAFLGVFNEHERAKNAFIHNLHGRFQWRCLSRFNKKWKEYEEEYNDIKQQGVFAVAMAIAPTEEALRNAKPGDARKWENDRKDNLHNIILALFEISKQRIWY